MKCRAVILLLAACVFGFAQGEDLDPRALPTFAPPSPPPPPLVGFGCPSLEFAFVLHQYSYLNFGNDEGAAVCKAIKAMTPYRYAKCEFVYRYGYRSNNQLPALLDGIIAGKKTSTVVFVSIKFGIPQVPDTQKWYNYASKNRTALMNTLSYQPTLASTIQKAIDWPDYRITTLENCAAFMFGFDTYTSDENDINNTYWEPHPSPPDVLPSDPAFVPTPPFLYFGGKGCACYYDTDILDEKDNVLVPAAPFTDPTCQVFLNSDNEPTGSYYIFSDTYWSATEIDKNGEQAYGVRGCYTEMPKPDPVVCDYKGVFRITPVVCQDKVLSFSAKCGARSINLRLPSQAPGFRKNWIFNSTFDSEGAVTAAPIRGARGKCKARFIKAAPTPILSAGRYKFKILPTGTDCHVVRIYGLTRPKASKYLAVNGKCNALKFTKESDHANIFRLRKVS